MLFIIALSAFTVALCVAIHYEFLFRLSDFICTLGINHRSRVVVGVMLALAAHVIEIIIFGGVYFLILDVEHIGGFIGTPIEDLADCIYFSFVTYTTLGFGDMIPQGWMRFMVGVEAMTGLVSIAWTASYLYFQMEQNWKD